MMMFPKESRWASEKYLAWVRDQPCCMCQSWPSEPHHLKGIGHLSGASLKAPDWATMPMCRQCHEKMHRGSSLWPMQWEYVARTLGRAITEGVFKVK